MKELILRLDYDLERNLLRLSLGDEAAVVSTEPAPGLVDMAAGGRLIGIEVRFDAAHDDVLAGMAGWLGEASVVLGDDDAAYIELTSGPDDEQSRSTDVELLVERGAAGEVVAIGIPRRGVGYEISYPSGNR